MPSELESLTWQVTLADIKFKLNTKLSVENLRGIQTYQAVAEVLSAVFGGKKQSSAPTAREAPPQDGVPRNGAEAMSMFSAVMGGG